MQKKNLKGEKENSEKKVHKTRRGNKWTEMDGSMRVQLHRDGQVNRIEVKLIRVELPVTVTEKRPTQRV